MLIESARESKSLMEELSDDSLLPSENLDIKIKFCINKHAKKRRFISLIRQSYHVLSKVSVFVLVLLIILSILFTRVSALQEWYLSLLIDIKPEYVRYYLHEKYGSSGQNIFPLEQNRYILSYLPEDMRLVSYDDSVGAVVYRYVNKLDHYISLQILSSGQMHVDNENLKESRQIRIHDQNARLVKKNGVLGITWLESDLLFTIFTNLSEDETIKIAEGIIAQP